MLTLDPSEPAGHLEQVNAQRAEELHGLRGLASTHGEIVFASHCIRLPGNCGALSIGVIRSSRRRGISSAKESFLCDRHGRFQ